MVPAGYAGQGRYGSHDSATSPELESAVDDAEFQMKAAEADYENMKATQPKAVLDLQSQVAPDQ